MNNELLVKIGEADLNLEQLRVLKIIVDLKIDLAEEEINTSEWVEEKVIQ